MLLTRYFC